jgi:ribosome-associated protein
MTSDLAITDGIIIPAAELEWVAVRSSGPGGQNVNKVATKVELRFDLAHTLVLDAATRARLTSLARGRLDASGRIIVTSQVSRSQERNLEDAREKLAALIRRALTLPKPRRPTKPSRGAKERRLQAKRVLAEKKKVRGAGCSGDD